MKAHRLFFCFLSLVCALKLFSQPIISSFSPSSGPVGTTVTIIGTNFSSVPAENIVYFGAVKASVNAASPNTIEVQVPISATYQPITVTTNGLTASSTQYFHVTFPNGMFTRSLFVRQSIARTGSNPYHVSVGDLDGDGKVDAVYVNMQSNTISLFHNKSVPGTFSFDPKIDLAVGTEPRAAALADLDGDGKLDIVVANAGYPSYSLSIFRNVSTVGILSFETVINYPAGAWPNSIAIADLDGDGRPELAVCNSSSAQNTLSVYRNSSSLGHISFSGITNFGTGINPYCVALGDLNNDGKIDIAVANAGSNTVSLLKNTSSQGTLSFTEKTDLSTGVGSTSPYFVGIADLNDDQRPDLYVSNYITNTIAILQNSNTDDAFSFLPAIEKSSGRAPWGIAIGDFDGDGKPDLAVPNYYDFQPISYYKNLSSSAAVNFTNKTDANYTLATYTTWLAGADMDGDGKPDIVVSPQGVHEMEVAKNKGVVPAIVPSGTNPVTAPVTTKVTVDSFVQEYNGQAYVQRHYDIEPANNPATSTATITLFFSQQDFDNYNAHPNHGGDLPKNPTDSAGIANLRVQQQHGFSTTGVPGSYSGNAVVIDPSDSNIVWNPTCACWEITFDVNGFSGFFINSAAGVVLPVKLLAFKGNKMNSANQLQWSTAQEAGLDYFELQHSTDGRRFVSLAKLPSQNNCNGNCTYTYIDADLANQTVYYRLIMKEKSGVSSLSQIIRLDGLQPNNELQIYPNPTKGTIVVKHQQFNTNVQIEILDMLGRRVDVVTIKKGASQTQLNFSRYSKGSYQLKIWDGNKQLSKTILIE